MWLYTKINRDVKATVNNERNCGSAILRHKRKERSDSLKIFIFNRVLTRLITVGSETCLANHII